MLIRYAVQKPVLCVAHQHGFKKFVGTPPESRVLIIKIVTIGKNIDKCTIGCVQAVPSIIFPVCGFILTTAPASFFTGRVVVIFTEIPVIDCQNPQSIEPESSICRKTFGATRVLRNSGESGRFSCAADTPVVPLKRTNRKNS